MDRWELLNIGRMDVECPDCHALYWKEECTSLGNLKESFIKCCYLGGVRPPAIPDLLLELIHLFTSNDDEVKKFRKYI